MVYIWTPACPPPLCAMWIPSLNPYIACFPMYENVSNLCSPFCPPQESVKLPPSAHCPPIREWVLVDVVKSSHLGSRKRLARLEKLKQTRIGPGMITTQPILFHPLRILQCWGGGGGILNHRSGSMDQMPWVPTAFSFHCMYTSHMQPI